MPASSAYGAGGFSSARAMSTSRGRLLLDGTTNSRPLLTLGMPRLYIWMRQTNPAILGQGAQITVQFSVRPLTVGPSPSDTDEWLALLPSPVVVDPLGTPTILNLEWACSKIRLRGINADGAAATTVDYVLGCSG